MVADGSAGMQNDDSTGLAVPPKRKRGRPRTNPVIPEDIIRNSAGVLVASPGFGGPGVIEDDSGRKGVPGVAAGPPKVAVSVPAGFEARGLETAVLAKRKRGRPRKVPAPETGVLAGPVKLLALEPCEGSGVVGHAAGIVKRRPGRPRKNALEMPIVPVMVKGGAVVSLAERAEIRPGIGVGAATVEHVSALAPLKWKRGRPRKNPLPEALTAVAPVAAAPAPDRIEVAPEKVEVTVKRKPGRPRKNPLPPEGIGRAGPESAEGTVAEKSPGGDVGSPPVTALEKVEVSEPEKPSEAGSRFVERFGIGPANDEGIGFWPPRPEEVEAVKLAARAAGVVRRGRKPKAPVPEGPPGGPDTMPPESVPRPDRPEKRPRTMPDALGKPFCGKCGTYTRLIQPERGPARRVCPKCRPQMVPIKRSPLDRTGKPCQDRGVCRPERCVIAFECEEMKRTR